MAKKLSRPKLCHYFNIFEYIASTRLEKRLNALRIVILKVNNCNFRDVFYSTKSYKKMQLINNKQTFFFRIAS